MQLQGTAPIEYRCVRELDVPEQPRALAERRKQIGMDDDSEGQVLLLEATCTISDKMIDIKDEPMACCVDVAHGEIRAHFVSPTKPELGGVVLIWRDGTLEGGDERGVCVRRRVAAAPPLRRGYSVESRRRRGCDVDIPC